MIVQKMVWGYDITDGDRRLDDRYSFLRIELHRLPQPFTVRGNVIIPPTDIVTNGGGGRYLPRNWWFQGTGQR